VRLLPTPAQAAALEATLRANLRNGTCGPANSPRRLKAESKPISFRPLAAQPFDDRCLSWDHDARTISIWTSTGRAKNVAFTGSAAQLARLREHRRGEPRPAVP
jgi:hypothetical protein